MYQSLTYLILLVPQSFIVVYKVSSSLLVEFGTLNLRLVGWTLTVDTLLKSEGHVIIAHTLQCGHSNPGSNLAVIWGSSGSVGRAVVHKPQGKWFNSQSSLESHIHICAAVQTIISSWGSMGNYRHSMSVDNKSDGPCFFSTDDSVSMISNQVSQSILNELWSREGSSTSAIYLNSLNLLTM